ncbi:MAG: hypothetical protein ACT6U0_08690 [Shinella sp.]|uniref:hypothetical protein n=1 Tax=Shinella sp. TaxID=1870904 RepID=UPI00403755EE
MTPAQFLDKIISKCFSEFKQHIQTGAQWEISAQTTISNNMFSTYQMLPVRELHYKNFCQDVESNDACDLVITDPDDKTQLIWLELKVESAQNSGQFAGKSLAAITNLNSSNNDWSKLKKLPDNFVVPFMEGGVLSSSAPFTNHRWLMAVAYSSAARSHLLALPNGGASSNADGTIVAWVCDIDAASLAVASSSGL